MADSHLTLLLFPTDVERVGVGDVGGNRDGTAVTEICGFGPVAAGARTAQLLSRIRPRRVVLVGIAGTYDEHRLPVGAAATFDEVVLDGVGTGQGASFRDAAALGFAHWPGSDDTCRDPVGESLLLDPLPGSDSAASPTSAMAAVRWRRPWLPDPRHRLLVTTCAASASPSEAAARRGTYKDALAEDMEAFAVALACALHRVPVSVVRGISNVAGDRQRSNWKVEAALRGAARLLEDVLERNTPESETRPR